MSHRDYPKKEAKVYSLLDDVSDTFITTKVQQALGIEGVETELTLSTMSGKEVISVSRIDGLVAEGLDRREKVDLPKTYAKESISCRGNQIPTAEMADKWPHFKKIKGKIPKLDADIEIGLLIGCNCPKAIKPKEVITGKSDDPYVVRTLLGWCIVGPVQLCAKANRERLRGRIWRASSRLYPKWFLCWWWFEVSPYHSVSGGFGKECKGHVSSRWFQSPQVVIQQQRRNQEHPRKWENWGCQRNGPRLG